MTHRDPDPITPLRPCPRCASTDAVTEATSHERDRTDCDWWCDHCRLAFTGTAAEFQRVQAQQIAAEAERMATRPQNREDQP